MKKIFLLASVAVMVMASCAKNEIIEAPATPDAIGFSTYIHKATKATLNTITQVQTAAQFPIVAYVNTHTGNDISQSVSSATDFFTDVLKYASSSWATDIIRYWPSTTVAATPTQTLSFFAYYPSADVTYNKSTYPTAYPTLSYSVVDDPANQIDLLASANDKVSNANGSNDNVALQLNHILTQVNFALKGDKANLRYVVTALKIGSALGNAGVYTFVNNTWNVTAGTKEYTYPAASFASYYTDATTALATGTNSFVLMPQALGASNEISVTYSVRSADGVVEILPSSTKTATLSGTWAPAESYLYTITLPADLNPIEYTVTVGTWTAAAGAVTLN